MGSIVSGVINENMKKMQKTQMEIMMKQRQTMLAIQFAGGKDLFHWYSAFFATASTFCILGTIKKQNPLPLIPLLPLGFIFAYQYDLYYGNKMNRIKTEAERIIREEPQRFYFPKNSGIISEEDYNQLLNIKKQHK